MTYNKYVEEIVNALRDGMAYTVDHDGLSAVAGTYVFFEHAKHSASTPKRIYNSISGFARDPRDFVVWRPIFSSEEMSWASPWGPGQVTVNLRRACYKSRP